MDKYTFNVSLAHKRGLTKIEMDELQKLYNKVEEIFEVQRAYIDEDIKPEPSLLQSWDEMLHDIEFKMQELWKFEKDESYHHYWFEQPFCSCPKMDNHERIGTGDFIINCNCPVHGHQCADAQNVDQETGC